MSGDRLYNSCVAYLKECNKFLDKMLMVDEIQRKFDLENKEVQLDIQDCLVNGIISAKEDMGIPSLKQVRISEYTKIYLMKFIWARLKTSMAKKLLFLIIYVINIQNSYKPIKRI